MSFGSVVGALSKEVSAVTETAKKTITEKATAISETGIREYTKESSEKFRSEGEVVLEKLDDIKNMNPEQLKEKLYETLDERVDNSDKENNNESSEKADESNETKEGLTDEQKLKIKEETGWSDEIIEYIGSWEEYEIYKKAGLQEVEIGNKKCLIRDDIDWDQVDEKGRTNTERVKRGLAPLDKNGDAIQLHHIGQHADSPLAELTFEEHRCNGNDTILHDKSKETETHGEGNTWDSERQTYWKDRANYNEGVNDNG